MKEYAKIGVVAFLLTNLIASVLLPVGTAFAEGSNHYYPDLDEVYERGDGLEFETVFDGSGGNWNSASTDSYWNHTYYLNKEGELVLANAISDVFYINGPDSEYTGDWLSFELPLGEDLAAHNSEYDCITAEDSMKCTVDTYKMSGNPYESIDSYYFIGAVNSCDNLNLTGDAKTFCEAHSNGKSIKVFLEKEDEAIFIASETPLIVGNTADVELRINTDREIEYVELYLDPNCVKVNSIGPYDGWTLDTNESGEGRYYFKANSGIKGGTVAGFNITVLADLSQNGRFLSATAMSAGQSYDVNISSADVFFSFTPSESGYYAFTSFDNGNSDSYAYLYMKDGDEYRAISWDDDSSSNNNFRLERELQAGTTYYLRASKYGDDIEGVSYKVRVERSDGSSVSDDIDFSPDEETISLVRYLVKMDAYVGDNHDYGCGEYFEGTCSEPYSKLSDYLSGSGSGGRGAGGWYGGKYYYGFDTLFDSRSCGWSNSGDVTALSAYRSSREVPVPIYEPVRGTPYIPSSPVAPDGQPSNPDTVDSSFLAFAVLAISVAAITSFYCVSAKKNRSE